jgi:hypothetical protein
MVGNHGYLSEKWDPWSGIPKLQMDAESARIHGI